MLPRQCCAGVCTSSPSTLRSVGERKLGLPFSDLHQKVALSKTFGTIRSVTSTIKSATVNAAASAAGQVCVVAMVAKEMNIFWSWPPVLTHKSLAVHLTTNSNSMVWSSMNTHPPNYHMDQDKKTTFENFVEYWKWTSVKIKWRIFFILTVL